MNVMKFGYFCWILLFEGILMKKIMVYIDDGAGLNSIGSVINYFGRQEGEYSITAVNANSLKHGELDGDILVMPGGADLPYVHDLNGIGNANIRKFVENGGKYLGICAGSYYGASYVSFSPENPEYEVKGPRELKFFQGSAIGPLFPNFEYNSNRGVSFPTIIWKQTLEEFPIMFNGGGYFLPFKFDSSHHLLNHFHKTDYEILASYLNSNGEEFSIIGKGLAVLSGGHFEFDPDLEDENDEYLKDKLPAYKAQWKQTQKLGKYIISYLNNHQIKN